MKILKKVLSPVLCLTMLLSNVVTVKAATNLALGKTTFASSHYDEAGNYGPEKVTDGNYNNVWSMGSIPLLGARGGVAQYIAVDLGEAYMLDSIVAASRRGLDDLNARSGWYAQVANNEYFTDAVTIRAGYNTVEYQGNYTFVCDFDTPYRYVRICSPNYFTVAEIEVYGEKYDPTTMNRKTVFSDTEGEFYQPGAMLLSALDIMSGISKNEFAGERILTRAQAARIMTSFAQLPLEKSDKQVFDDVPVDHWAADYIYTATKAGVISSDTNFRPDDYVTDKEFLKLVLYAMGYGEYVELRGGWDKGVYDVSDRFNLTKRANVTKYEYLTRGSASMILFNALNTPLPEEQVFALDGSHHIGQSDETMLESEFGLTVITGKMTENSTTSLIKPVDNGVGTVKIGNSIYSDSDQIMEFWIGKNVGIAVDKDSRKEIKAAWVDTKETDTIKIYDFQRTDEDESYYEYEDESEKKRTLKLSDKMFLVKNNSAITDWTKDDLICPDGYIEFVDNDTDGVYDVALCFEPTVMVASFASNDSGNVNVVAIDGSKVSGNNLNYLYITKNGKNSTAGRIAANDIVKAYQSPCGKSLWIDVGGESITATVGAMTEDGVELDGVVAEYTEFYKNNRTRTDSLVIGKTMTILLDNMGRVVWVVKGSGVDIEETIGYVIKITNDNAYTDEPIHFKLFSEHGAFAEYDVASRIVVDGRRYQMEELRTRIMNSGLDIEGQFVMYKANKDGQLVWMDTEMTDIEKNSKMVPLTDELGNKIKFGTSISGVYNVAAGEGIYKESFLLQPLKKDTLAFIIPVDGNNDPVDEGYDDFYKVSTAERTWTTLNQFPDRTEFYGLDDNNYPTFGVRYKVYTTAGAGGVRAVDNNDAQGMVVNKVLSVINDDNEIIKEIHGYDISKGSEVVIKTDGSITSFFETGKIQQSSEDVNDTASGTQLARSEWLNSSTKYLDITKADQTKLANYIKDISALKKGDVVLYQLSGDYIYSLERVFSIDDADYSTYKSYAGSYYTSGSEGTYPTTPGASFKLMFGKVTGINGEIIHYENGPASALAGYPVVPINLPYTKMQSVFIVEGGAVTVDAASNLPALMSIGDEMVVYTTSGNFRSAIIYR